MKNLQDSISQYQMPTEAIKLIRQHRPLGLAGPTGAGKGTLAQYLTQSGHYAPIVSDTTRAPRPSGNGYEVNGVQYWFLDEAQAIQKLADNGYIEAKLVHGDTLYGTSIAAYRRVIESNRVPILEIDIQGMEEIMKLDDTFEAVLLLPPNFDVWNERIDGRGDMTPENKVRRFKTALTEYDVVFQNERFYPVVNTEVVDVAQVIQEGTYRDPRYRHDALLVAKELRDATKAFLDQQL